MNGPENLPQVVNYRLRRLVARFHRSVTAAIGITGLLLIVPLALKGSAAVFYKTRSAFNQAKPGLPVESFNSAKVPRGGVLLESAPITSATEDGILSRGNILPGLAVSNANLQAKPGLIIYGDGTLFHGTKSVGTNWLGDTLVLTFQPAVEAVGTDIFAATSPGQTLAGDFTVNAYNGPNLLGSTTISETTGGYGFVGISSTEPITRVTILYTSDDASTFVDNISFGTSTKPVRKPTHLLQFSTYF